MKSRHSATVLTSVGWDLLAGILILFPFPAVTQADPDPGLSLTPDPLRECDTLTATWPPAKHNPPFYSVKIVDNNSSQTIFQTNVTGPPTTATWVVNATNGASLHLAIHTPPDLTSNHYTATGFQVHSGSSACFSSSALVTLTSTTTTPSTMSSPAPFSTTPSAPTSTATSSNNTPEQTGKPRSLSSTGNAYSSSEPTHIFPSLLSSSTLDTSSSSLPVDTAPSGSHSPPRALNQGAIAGIVIGSLLGGIALAIVALYLLWRRARPRTAAKQSSFTSHVGWLPRISRSRYPARDSLSSDSYLSEVESVKPIAAWKPELFVREKPETGYAASRLPLVQHPSLPSGTPETVPSAEERRA